MKKGWREGRRARRSKEEMKKTSHLISQLVSRCIFNVKSKAQGHLMKSDR